MEKMRMESLDMTAQNIEKIGALFPNCITETVDENGKAKKAINFELLKQMLSGDVIEGSEAYEFTWVGKKAAIVEANKPIRKTLRPCKEESVNWDTTENLYIEGDNLEVLKLLQESYLGAVKMIYIDPPYNTGSDRFVYPDSYMMDREVYEDEIGLFDDVGNILFKENNANNPRFHSVWCSMMYARLSLARNLLREDGVMFVSIGENELDNTIKIGTEIFGAANLIGIVSRVAKTASNKGTFFAPTNDYIVVLAKNADVLPPFYGEVDETLYPKVETSGAKKGEKYRDDVALYQSALDPLRGCINQRYYIEAPDGSLLIPPGKTMPDKSVDGAHIAPKTKDDKVWRWSYETYFQKKELLVFKETKTSPLLDENGNKAKYNVYTKSYLSDRQDTGTLPRTLWTDFINRKGADLLKKMGIPFDFSKPYELVEYILKIIRATDDDYVMDFFSGSGTTAHAVMQYNATNNCRVKHIMVQLQEQTDEQSEAYKAGYINICEIGKERIRRAGKEIKEKSPLLTQNLDTGFRVFKLDESNMNDVWYSTDEYSQGMLSMLESNVKADRTDLDLLFGCLLEWGLPLSLPYTSETIEGCTVHTYNDGDLIACFDENIPDSVIKTIAKRQPLRAVFRDSSFADSPSKINVGEVFKLLAPDTRVKVI